MCLIVVDLFDALVRACASMDPARPTGSCLKDVLLYFRTVFRRLLRSTFAARLVYGFFYARTGCMATSVAYSLGFRESLVADRRGFLALFYTGVGAQLHGLAPCDVFTRDSNPRLPVVSVNLIR